MALLLFPVLMLLATWIFLIRPQQRRLREREALVAALEPGDRVVTAGGIHGTIQRIDGPVLELEVAVGVVVTLDARAIGQVIRDEEPDEHLGLDDGIDS